MINVCNDAVNILWFFCYNSDRKYFSLSLSWSDISSDISAVFRLFPILFVGSFTSVDFSCSLRGLLLVFYSTWMSLPRCHYNQLSTELIIVSSITSSNRFCFCLLLLWRQKEQSQKLIYVCTFSSGHWRWAVSLTLFTLYACVCICSGSWPNTNV